MATDLPTTIAEPSTSVGHRLRIAGLLAVAAAVLVFLPERDDGTGAMAAGAMVFCAAAAGLSAVARVRPLPTRSLAEHGRLAGLALMLGSALGVANLMANYAIASLDPTIHAQMSTEFAKFSGWGIVVSGPLIEEIVVRLFLMSVIAWLVSRHTDDRRAVFLAALIVSSALFAFAHILPGSRPTTGVLHATGVAIKTGAAGLLLGWTFWRWGLPHTVLCHSTANAVHFVALPIFF